MSRAQDIVDSILMGERYANSTLFDQKVYGDEPILRTGARAFGPQGTRGEVPRRTRLPQRYKELRRLARGRTHMLWGNAYSGGGVRIFVEQARLLAGYEDSYDGVWDPFGYRGNMPTYEDLSDHDLRCYVSWRTSLLAGEALEAPSWFLLIHAYEIINGAGIEPSVEGYKALVSLAQTYESNSYATVSIRRWARDYVVYYGLDASLLEGQASSSYADAIAVLRKAEESLLATQFSDTGVEPEVLLDALVQLSRYRADRSRFFRDHREDVAWVVSRVFADMISHCAKRRKTGFVDGMFGTPTRQVYTIFRGAPFLADEPHEDAAYAISPSERFVCERGFWWRELPYRREDKNKDLGALLHAIDARMRRATGDKHALKEKPLPKYQGKFVDTRIAELCAMREAEEAARIVIDRSALGQIRSASVRTREALLTDEEREEHVEPVAPVMPTAPVTPVSTTVPAAKAVVTETSLPLDEKQTAVLAALLDGRQPEGSELFVSLAIDAINEAFLDIVGDTIIDFDGDTPVLVEDYLDEVHGFVEN